MSSRMHAGPAAEWSAEDWGIRLAQLEATAALGEADGDGTIRTELPDGRVSLVWEAGLNDLRERVAEIRGEVAQLEQQWLL